MTPLETPRLVLCPYLPADREFFVDLNCDSEVRRYMNGPLTPPAADQLFSDILAGQAGGLDASWAITERGLGAFVGHAFLNRDESHPFPELGFLLLKQFWGRGYATESARRLVEYSWTELALPGLSASVDCDHAPSQRVLEKAGFRRESTAVDEHGSYYIYTIEPPGPR